MDWDEEDELLYGGGSSSAGPVASTSGTSNASPMPAAVNPPISLTENGTASLIKSEGGSGGDQDEADMEQSDGDGAAEGSEDGEEDMDDAESEDSLEIVMDINPNAPRPAHEMARRVGAVPVRPPPAEQIQQLQRQPSASSAINYNTRPDSASPQKPPANPFLSLPAVTAATVRPTGQPIPTRSRTPPPDLSSRDAQYTPAAPLGENGEAPMDFKPQPQPIVDVDIESIEDKRWRRSGAHMADYFNYGFDEPTWIEWCAKQKRMRDERDKERENPFHVFASKPLPEAWQGLPMEQKGALMQVIMTSFGAGAPGGGMHPAMAGMMGGPGGPMGMPGGMGMPNMGGMMGRNPMAMMQGMSMMQQQQQQQQQGNMGNSGSNTPIPGMMGHMGMQSQQQQRAGMGAGGSQSHEANGDDEDDSESYQDRHSQSGHFQQGRRPRINPLLVKKSSAAEGGEEEDANGMFKKRNVSGQHQKRAPSPLPDNLPKGPKRMFGR